MQTTEDYFVIRVPRFAGYKTLVVNAAVILGGIIAAVYPQFGAKIDPTAFASYYDAITGGIIAMIGVVNVILRLVSTGPAAPFKKSSGDAGEDPAQKLAFTAALLESKLAKPQPVIWTTPSGVDDSTHKAMYMAWNGERDHTNWKNWTGKVVFDAVEGVYEQQPDGPVRCQWPECACHQRCDCETYPVVQLTAEEKRRDAGLARRMTAAFLVPFIAVPLMFASVAMLAGCETVQAVNAVASAESVEQRGFALYGTYVVLQERAAELVTDKAIPKAVRKRVQQADGIAFPLAERVRALSIELNEARLKFNTLSGGAERVQLAVVALARAIEVFGPSLQAVTAAVNEARA